MARIEHSTNNTPRVVNIALGAWVFISSFLWLHSGSQFWNSLIVGGLVAVFALAAVRVRQLRFVNAALGAWLFFSVWALPTLSSATGWNNAIVGAAIFIVSLIGVYRPAPERGPLHA